MKCLLWTDEKGWRKGGYLSLGSLSWILFLVRAVDATCSGPSHPRCLVWMVISAHFSILAGATFTTAAPAAHLVQFAALPVFLFPLACWISAQHLILLRVYLKWIWPYQPRTCYLLLADFHPENENQLSSTWLSSSRNLCFIFCSCHILRFMAGFCVSVVTSIIFVNLNGPWGRMIAGQTMEMWLF